jgi:hypothetical protein
MTTTFAKILAGPRTTRLKQFREILNHKVRLPIRRQFRQITSSSHASQSQNRPHPHRLGPENIRFQIIPNKQAPIRFDIQPAAKLLKKDFLRLSAKNRFHGGGKTKQPGKRPAPEFQTAIAGIDAIRANPHRRRSFSDEVQCDALPLRRRMRIRGRANDDRIAGLSLGLHPIHQPIQHLLDTFRRQVVNPGPAIVRMTIMAHDIIRRGRRSRVNPVQIDIDPHRPQPGRDAQRAGCAVGQAGVVLPLLMQPANQLDRAGQRLVLVIDRSVQIEQDRLIG